MSLRLIAFVLLQFGLVHQSFALDWANFKGSGFKGTLSLNLEGVSDITIDSVSFYADIDFPNCVIICNNGSRRVQISTEWESGGDQVYFKTQDFSQSTYELSRIFRGCAIRIVVSGHDSQGRTFRTPESELTYHKQKETCQNGISTASPLTLILNGGVDLTSGRILAWVEN